jgi:hypothetical protein
MQTVDCELIVKAFVVSAFEHSGTQSRVDFQSGSQNSPRDRFVEHEDLPSVSSVSSVVMCLSKQRMDL